MKPVRQNRLIELAKKRGRTRTCHAREANVRHLEDLQDIYLAKKRLRRPAQTYSAPEVKRELDL